MRSAEASTQVDVCLTLSKGITKPTCPLFLVDPNSKRYLIVAKELQNASCEE